MNYAIRLLIFLVQVTSMLIVVFAAARLAFSAGKEFLKFKSLKQHVNREIYVSYILLALEVLLAAGVLSTILHPAWSAIGKLAAIAALRTLIKRSLRFSVQG